MNASIIRTVGVSSVLGVTAILSAITSESILTFSALAVGTASAIVWVWRAPQNLQLKADAESTRLLLASWSKRLDESEKATDVQRQKVVLLREALVEAGIRIRELEEESGLHGHGATVAK